MAVTARTATVAINEMFNEQKTGDAGLFVFSDGILNRLSGNAIIRK